MNRPIVAIGAPAAAPLAAYTAPCSVEAVVEVVRAIPGDVLLATRDDAARRVARGVRLLLGADRVGVLHTPLPFTAWVAAIHVLATMPPDVEMSRSGEVAVILADALRTRVVLSSVASLERPAPTVAQHARGLLPGALFDVDLAAGTVDRFAGTLTAQSPLVAVARSAKPLPGPVEDGLPASRLDLGTVDAGWKAARWVEVTTLDEQQWYAATVRLRQPGAAVARCHACDRAGAPPACLFCEIPLYAGAPAPADVPVGGVPE